MEHGSSSSLGCFELLADGLAEAVSHMELGARTAKEGTVSGRHASPHKGFSVEFAEHRAYAPGDDPRHLDWRVIAKRDRYYIRQYVEETNLRATLLVDRSGSMGYTGEEAAEHRGRRLSKFDYARRLAAALAYVMIRQQDAVGLVTFDQAVQHYLPARGRPDQVRQILQTLYDGEVGEPTAIAPVLHEIAERIPRRGLVILISDLFDDEEDILEALHHFAYHRHELIVLHVMAEEERTFPFRSVSRFYDLEEAGADLPLDPLALRTEYLENLARFTRRLEAGCGELKADYIPVNTRDKIEDTVIRYLGWRRHGT